MWHHPRYVRYPLRLVAVPPLLAIAAALSLGCASYTPHPLDPAAHREAWRERSVQSESLAAFADRLANTGRPGTPAAFDPSDGLSLAEAEVVALFFHPTLRRLRIDAHVPFVTAENSGQWSDFEFEVAGEHVLDSVPEPFLLETGLRFTIPLSGRLGAEKEERFAAYSAAMWQVRVAEAALIEQLRATWLAWSYLAQQQQELATYRESVAAIHAIVIRLAEAGAVRAAESRLFTIELRQLDDHANRIAAAERLFGLRLRQQMGLQPEAPVSLQPQLQCEEPPAGDIDALLAEHPEIAARAAEHDAAEALVRLEIQRQYPDISLGIGFAYEEGMPRLTWGIGLPIPALDGNRTAIATSRAQRESTAAAYAEQVEQLVHRLAQTEAERDAVVARLAWLRAELVPLLDQQLEEAQQLAELGEFDAFLLLDALTQQHEMRLTLLALQERIALQDASRLALLRRSYIPPPAEDEATGDDARDSNNENETDEETDQ